MSIDYVEFERRGFALLKNAIPESDIENLTNEVEKIRASAKIAGIRNLLTQSKFIRTFATHGKAFAIAEQVLGCAPQPVRAILFDKTPISNWYVTWHQDLSIPVQAKIDVDGYGPWSTKNGILHVQPPANVLEQMVSLRIHLDACGEENGAIKFFEGSHLKGVFDQESINSTRKEQTHISCPADRGDIILMRPLILHSSSEALLPNHRRVLHLEYAGTDLPNGLQWGEA